MTLNEVLNILCTDQEGLKGRFMNNDALIVKFLKKFLEDQSYDKMAEDVQNKDYEALEASSHTLKGLAGNLGLSKVYETSMNILTAVREKDYDRIAVDFEEAKAAYEEAVSCIKQLD